MFNISVSFTMAGVYSYRWHSWGNGSLNNYNASDERSYYVNVSVDSTPPYFTTIPANASLEYMVDSLEVDFDADDENVFDSYVVNDTINFQINSSGGLTNITGLSIRLYILNITINDSNNNLNSTIYQVNVSDTTVPEVSIIYPLNVSYSVNVSDLNYTYSDFWGAGYCWYSNDSGTNNYSIVSAGVNWTGLISNEGSNTWSVYCNDSYNNLNFSSITFTKDIVYPDILIIYPINNTNTTNTGIDVNYTYSDDINVDSCWYSNDSMTKNTSLGTGGVCLNITTITWVEGLHNMIIWINDTSGNENKTSVSFRIDTTAPSFDNLRNFKHQANTSFSQAITATDSGVGVKNYGLNDTNIFSIDNNGAITNGTALTGISIYYLNISVNDSLDNLNSGIFYINVTSDATWPVISLINPADVEEYTSNSESITFIYNVSDNSDITNCSLIVNNSILSTDDSVNKSETNSFVSSFAPGIYNWSINCTDSFENIGNSSLRGFVVTAPVTVTPPSGGGGGGGGAAVLIKNNLIISHDNLDIEISKNGVKTKKIELYNNGSSAISVKLNISGSKEIFDISSEDLSFSLGAGEKRTITVRIFAPEELGIYTGKIMINNEELLFSLNVETEEALFDVKVNILDDYKVVNKNGKIISKIILSPVGDLREDVILNYTIRDYDGNIYYSETKTILVDSHKEFIEEFSTVGLEPGKYILGVELKYSKGVASSTAQFSVRGEVLEIFKNKIVIYSILAGCILIVLIYILIRKLFLKNKKTKRNKKKKRK